MATGIFLKERKNLRRKQERPGGVVLHRFYEMPKGKTLADVSMERGDALPDDANALIQSVGDELDKNGIALLLHVTAWKANTYS